MLEFDNSHKSIEGNLDNRNGKRHSKITVLGILLVSGMLLFSGCARDLPCDIDYAHAHYYANQEEFGRYIVSEKSSISGLDRTDKVMPIYKEGEKTLLDFANKNGLFKISENKEAIERICETQFDHREYEVSLTYPVSHVKLSADGKQTSIEISYVTQHSWTSDPNEATSEETRDCHYIYYGYKIERDENGEYIKIKSDPVDSISLLSPEYEYVEMDFYRKVNAHDYSQEFYDHGDYGQNYGMGTYSIPLN